MKLDGMHHITMITGDARRNVDFYADKLGLRLVKKTVNFDAPDAYHLYFGDEQGTPGTILTWFEFAGARRGRAGAGMIHTIQLGVASEEALEFWAKRLGVDGPGFTAAGDDFELGGFTWGYDAPPAERGLQGAGTVHHIAWASRDEDHLAWRQRVREAGAHVSSVRDRDYFQSIYFGEPRGILFE